MKTEDERYLEMIEASRPELLAKALAVVQHLMETELSACEGMSLNGEPDVKLVLIRHRRHYRIPGRNCVETAVAKTGKLTIAVEIGIEFSSEGKIPAEAFNVGPLITSAIGADWVDVKSPEKRSAP